MKKHDTIYNDHFKSGHEPFTIEYVNDFEYHIYINQFLESEYGSRILFESLILAQD